MKYELPTLEEARRVLRNCQLNDYPVADQKTIVLGFMTGRAKLWLEQQTAAGVPELEAVGIVMAHIGRLCQELAALSRLS